MDLTPWTIIYKPGWDKHYETLPKEIRERLDKKLAQMKQPLQGRGLHRSKYQVEEVEGYRIAYSLNQNTNEKEVHFVGNHKQYEKWYKQVIGFHDMDFSVAQIKMTITRPITQY